MCFSLVFFMELIHAKRPAAGAFPVTGPFYGWIILLSFLWDGQCHHQCPAPKENGQRLAAGGTGGGITAALRGGILRDNGEMAEEAPA